MPYWFETKKLRVGRKRDRRIKVTDDERKTIKDLFKIGFSIREIARIFKAKCSRRNIQFILFPERLRRLYIYKKERNWDYQRERHRRYVKKHREYLKSIYGRRNKRN